MSLRSRLLAVLGCIAAIAVIAAAAWPGDSTSGSSEKANAAPASAPASSPADDVLTRRSQAEVVEPVAGESGDVAALPSDEVSSADTAPSEPASNSGSRKYRADGNGPTGDAAISKAVVLKNGIALPPIEAPPEVERIIEAGNQIARTPYLWGGGHGKWLDKGYDCSGSVSYALAAAGLLNGPLASGPLMNWGKAGKGKWVTIYSNPGHVWLFVAGVRFDTSGTRKTGSRWQPDIRPTGGYVTRHPPGL